MMLIHSIVLACAAVLPPQEVAPGSAAEQPDLYVPARRWALVIGASDYPYLGKLSFASRDAEAFAGSLTERFGFDPSTVSLLTDKAEDPALRPTAGNMFLALRRLLADTRLQESDLFVFYFAGHGIGDESGDYLLPLDAALETVTDVGLNVQDVIQELTSAGMNNVLFVVDGCRTGNENTFGRELWNLAEEANLAVVLSCEPGMQSYEDRRLGGGIFTHYFVGAMQDATLVAANSGALWASRVAARVREQTMAWTSRGFDGQQVPQVWTDPTRDVLLGAQIPSGAEAAIKAFRSEVEGLDPRRYFAVTGSYAETLFIQERYAECAELLKAAEQMGALPPQLLYMLSDSLQAEGRLVEMTRVQQQLREADPDSFYTLAAIAHDFSGETSAEDRYRASRRILLQFVIPSADLALLIAFNMANGAPHAEAREVLSLLLPNFVPETRAWAYAQYMSYVLDGEYDRGLELLTRAEELPGDYPGNWRMRFERSGLLHDAQRNEELGDLLDQCVRDWPEEGSWLAQRAFFRYRQGDWSGAKQDAVAALEFPLEPWSLLKVVRAAGIESRELRDAVTRHAELEPLSWQAQLARAMASMDTVEEHQALLDGAKGLAPNLGTWSAMVASIQYERATEALNRGQLDGQSYSNLRYGLLEVLADRAASLDQGEGWELLCGLCGACSRQVQLVTLIDRHLGKAIAAGELQRALVGPVSMAFLEAGRLDRFHEVMKQAAPSSGIATSSAWLEVCYLLATHDDERARALAASLPDPDESILASATYAVACLEARAGDEQAARERIASAPTFPASHGLSTAMAGLAHEALGETEAADSYFTPLLGVTGSRPFFAKAACWDALTARGLTADMRAALAFAAGRDGIGNPLAARFSFIENPTIESFQGTVEFEVTSGDGTLSARGAEVMLSVRRAGKVSGIIELPSGDVWSLKGTIDAYGNLDAQLLGAERPARVLGKLATPEQYETCAPLVEHGLILLLLDEDGRASSWRLQLRP